MNDDEIKEVAQTTREPKNITILTDTSWLVALLDEKDSHHISAKSALGAMLPYKPVFHVPILVSIETMSRLIRVNNVSVAKCKKMFLDLISKTLHAKGARQMYEFKEILNRYESWKNKEIKSLTAIDFCVATEGIGLGAKILTCDLKMYKKVKKTYKEIYFISDKLDAQGSDLARLISDIQKNR